MKYYELALICSPDLSEEEINQFKETIISILQKEGGILNELRNPVKKILGTPIKNKREGFLIVMNFSALPEQLAKIETNIKSLPEMLRYLILNRKNSTIKEKDAPRKEVFKTMKSENLKKPKIGLKEIEKKLNEILGE